MSSDIPVVAGAKPWQCPECKTWIRADVTEHRCGPATGGVVAMPSVWPSGGGGGGSGMQPGVTVTCTNQPPGLMVVGERGPELATPAGGWPGKTA